jgi:hypothetical protein
VSASDDRSSKTESGNDRDDPAAEPAAAAAAEARGADDVQPDVGVDGEPSKVIETDI